MTSAPAKTAGDGQTTHVDVGMTAAGPDGDHTARRRDAEAAAQAAEARATQAAVEAKEAIAAAARAAATADAAAQEAEQADAVVRAAAQAETRAADEAARLAAQRAPRPQPRPTAVPRPAPAPRVSTEDLPSGDDVARHRPAPGPRRMDDETDQVEAVTPSPTGRAARRRAAAAETAVIAPVTVVDDGPATTLVPAIAAAPERRAIDDAPTTATPTRRSGRRRGPFRRPSRPALAAAVAGAVLALAGVLFAGNVVRPTPQPAAVIGSAVPSEEQPVVPVLPDSVAGEGDDESGNEFLADTDVDTLEDRSVRFLQELRAAGVPTSRGGLAETEAADLVCTELEDGVDEARIARGLTASLSSISRAQAAELVDIAQDNYCA